MEIKLTGNKNCFELAGGSSDKGFESTVFIYVIFSSLCMFQFPENGSVLLNISLQPVKRNSWDVISNFKSPASPFCGSC